MLWIPCTNIGRCELENPKTHITSEHGICRLNALSCGFYAGFRYLKDCGKFLVTVDRLRQLSENEPAVTASVFRSEEHTSELQSLMRISYAVFCLKKKKTKALCMSELRFTI